MWDRNRHGLWPPGTYRPRCQLGENNGEARKGRQRAEEAPVGIVALGPSTELSPDTAAVQALVPRALFCSHTGPGLRGPGTFSFCTQQVHTERSLPPPSPQFANLLVYLCKVPGEKRWRRGKRQALAGEPDAGSLSLKATVLEPFRILCLFLTPTRESTQ